MTDLFAKVQKLSLFVIKCKGFAQKWVEGFFESSFIKGGHRDYECCNIGHSFDWIFSGVCRLEKFRVEELLAAFLKHRKWFIDGHWKGYLSQITSNRAGESTHDWKL